MMILLEFELEICKTQQEKLDLLITAVWLMHHLQHVEALSVDELDQ
jgi:hypothetical protein